MISFEEMKDKVLATAGKVADKSVGLAKVAGDKAKLVGRITKLKTEIAMEKDNARKNFAAIGRLYYEKYKSNPDPDMAQAMEEISVSLEKIIIKERAVVDLKKELADDFGDVMDDAKDKAEDVVESVEEVIEDVTEDKE